VVSPESRVGSLESIVKGASYWLMSLSWILFFVVYTFSWPAEHPLHEHDTNPYETTLTSSDFRLPFPMQKGHTSVNGATLYYEVKGKGFPLVFISGGGLLDSRAWDRQFETFSKTNQVIRYDIRGIGKSGRPVDQFSHSADLYALLTFLKIKKAHVVGLSFGGGIAIDFALEHPEMVDHLILAATGTSSDAKGSDNLQALSGLSVLARKEGLAQTTQLIFNANTFISKDNLAAQEKIRAIYRDNWDAFENDFPLIRLWQPVEPASRNRLSEIRMKTLVMIAENDTAPYKAITENLAKRIPGATRVLIPGAAHVINLDKPDAFDSAVAKFIGVKLPAGR
jgi:3-oxoadipate enol-lactonase